MRPISIFAACFLGAVSMFLLGVITERKWAANRIETGHHLQMGGPQAQDEQALVDISDLDFPEALLEEVPSRNEGALAGNDTPERENQERDERNTPPDTPRQSERTNPSVRRPQANGVLFIQLGAFQSIENANRAVVSFDDRGLQAKVIKSNDPVHGLHYKVRMGPFESAGGALVTIEKLKQQNIPHFLVYPSG